MRKATGRPVSSASRWILVLSPPRERPRALSSEPLFAARGRLLVSAHDGRVDHQVLILFVRHKVGENALPDTRSRPAHEPRMHALVLAVTLRKIMPTGPRTKHPRYSVDELAIVRCSTANMLHSARKRVLDPLPLPFAQLISTRHATSATNQTPAAKSICGYRLGPVRTIGMAATEASFSEF